MADEIEKVVPKYYAVKASAVITEARMSLLNILCSVSIEQTPVTADDGLSLLPSFPLSVTLNNSRLNIESSSVLFTEINRISL